MNIGVTQVYVDPDATLPFSEEMQALLREELSALAIPSARFLSKYGPEYRLRVYLSARCGLAEREIRGPGVYRKTKDVEYTLFLPYDVIVRKANSCRVAMGLILDGIQEICAKAAIDLDGLAGRRAQIIRKVCSTQSMFCGPWPRVRRLGEAGGKEKR